jgi:Flp pilus assembly protein TadG
MERRERRGAELLEAALTLPVLLLVVAGIVDFGWYYSQQQSIQQAVRQGARIGVATSQEDDPPAAATQAAERALADAGLSVDVTVSASFATIPGGEQALEVQAEADYWGLWGLLSLPLEYGATTVMRMEEQP